MAAQTLRTALLKAENSHPGITHDLILGIIRRAELNLDMNESVLRLQGTASDYDGIIIIHNTIKKQLNLIKIMFNIINKSISCIIIIVIEYKSTRSEDAFQELNRKSTSLKRILSRIPDEITDRKTFLETIKYVFEILYYNNIIYMYIGLIYFFYSFLEKLQVQ